jgi:uncharacterized protein (DUF1697 family)
MKEAGFPSSPKNPAVSARYAALLRGINVAGKNKLAMKDLAALFAEAGCGEVVTYIQSGNVAFQATQALAGAVAERVSQAILDRYKLRVPMVTRSASELAAVAQGNPFLAAGGDVDRLYVAFLAGRPAASRVAALDPGRSPGDELVVVGREIYLHLPGGVGRSKLTNDYFDRTLGTFSTIRNWRTVLRMVELTGGA